MSYEKIEKCDENSSEEIEVFIIKLVSKYGKKFTFLTAEEAIDKSFLFSRICSTELPWFSLFSWGTSQWFSH